MIGTLSPKIIYYTYIFLFLINQCFKLQKHFLICLVKKNWDFFCRDQPLSFFTDFYIESFPTNWILLGHCLKKTFSYFIQFFHVIFLKERFKQFFYTNLYDLAEKIMAANGAEVINLFTISNSKISVREQSNISV